MKYDVPHLPGKKYFTKEIYSDPETFFTEDILLELDEIVKGKYDYGNVGTDDGEEDTDGDLDV